jgi:hypothetical protein
MHSPTHIGWCTTPSMGPLGVPPPPSRGQGFSSSSLPIYVTHCTYMKSTISTALLSLSQPLQRSKAANSCTTNYFLWTCICWLAGCRLGRGDCCQTNCPCVIYEGHRSTVAANHGSSRRTGETKPLYRREHGYFTCQSTKVICEGKRY